MLSSQKAVEKKRTLHRNLLLPCGFLPLATPEELNKEPKRRKRRVAQTQDRPDQDFYNRQDGYEASSSSSEDFPTVPGWQALPDVVNEPSSDSAASEDSLNQEVIPVHNLPPRRPHSPRERRPPQRLEYDDLGTPVLRSTVVRGSQPANSSPETLSSALEIVLSQFGNWINPPPRVPLVSQV